MVVSPMRLNEGWFVMVESVKVWSVKVWSVMVWVWFVQSVMVWVLVKVRVKCDG